MFKFLSILFIIIICGCNQTIISDFQNGHRCYIEKNITIFENQLYPFTFSDFHKERIIKYFNKNTLIDSGFNLTARGDSIKFYRFYNDDSRVIFDGFPANKIFNIAVLELNSDLFRFKNGIRIGIAKMDFFNTLELDESNCDTVDIMDIKRQKGYYFRFVFKNDILKSIRREYIHG